MPTPSFRRPAHRLFLLSATCSVGLLAACSGAAGDDAAAPATKTVVKKEKTSSAAMTTEKKEESKAITLAREMGGGHVEGGTVVFENEPTFVEPYKRLIFGDYDWKSTRDGLAVLEPRTTQGSAYLMALPNGVSVAELTPEVVTDFYGAPEREKKGSLWYPATAKKYLKFDFDDSGRLENILLVRNADDTGAEQPVTRYGEYALTYGAYGPHHLGDSPALWPEFESTAMDPRCSIYSDYEVRGFFYDDVLTGIEVLPQKLKHSELPLPHGANLMDSPVTIAEQFDDPEWSQHAPCMGQSCLTDLLTLSDPDYPEKISISGDKNSPAEFARTGYGDFVERFGTTCPEIQ